MHKIGLRVITYAPALQRQSSVANLRRRYPRNANINGFGFHVLTVQSNSIAMLAEIVIAPWGAIPTDYIDLAVKMSQFGQQVMQQIEFPHVIFLLVTCAVVAKKMIQRRNTFRKVLVAYSVNHIEMFSGMKVIEAKAIRDGIRGRRCSCRSCSGKERECQRGNETDNQRFL